MKPRGPAVLPFDADEAVRALSVADKRLARAIAAAGPFAMALKPSDGPFSSLAEAIVYQQLHGKAAASIYARVNALFGTSGSFAPHHVMGASDAALRGCGLSRAKTAALRDLAEKAAAGRVPDLAALEGMTDDAIVDQLTIVRGIGRWTVEMLLIFRLGRPDVLPATDFGVRAGFAHAFGKKELPSPKELLAYGERWRPWRTVASWYLWRAAEARAKADAKAPTKPASTARANAPKTPRTRRPGTASAPAKRARSTRA